METDHPWEYDDLIVTVKHGKQCTKCRYRILSGSKAVRTFGYFPSYRHYPDCPKSAAENKRLIDA